jgi:hypothetical protein
MMWDVLNSPFVIFVFSSIVVAGVTRYWDRRQSQKYEARDRVKYLLEVQNRLAYVQESLTDTSRLSIFDTWNVNNALNAGADNTYYKPLFLEFQGQPMSALLIFLQMTDIMNGEFYASLQNVVTEPLEEITHGLDLKEDEAQKADMEGLAQVWTYWELPPERVEKLKQFLREISSGRDSLRSLQSAAERRL